MPMPQIPVEGLQTTLQAQTQNQTVDVERTISAMRDSVWVINQELSREFFRNQSLRLLEANVGHLELKMKDTAISESGQDLSEIIAAIENGNQAIALIKASQPAQ